MTIRAFQIFRAGTWNSMQGPTTIPQSAVQEIATNYRPSLKAAKLVLGHPDVEDEGYGEVMGLAEHQGELFAFADVEQSLIDAVQAGRYKNVSASIYFPGSAGNPLPGSWYLRHVGFLGATPPAVKNMQPLSFAAPAEGGLSAAVNFAAAPGYTVDSRQMQLYGMARDIQHANPSIGFIQAAIMAERAIYK